VFPRTAKQGDSGRAKGPRHLPIVGEEYAPLGNTEYATTINKIKADAKPDAVVQTINGDATSRSWKQFADAGWSQEAEGFLSVVRLDGEDEGPRRRDQELVGQYSRGETTTRRPRVVPRTRG